jgi:hypothetical protein
VIVALAFGLARAWARLYTRGLPDVLRDRRRAEIACDLWEQRHEPGSRSRAPFARAADVLGRVLRGVPSDIAWRIEHRARGGVAQRLRTVGAGARAHSWTVFPALVALIYVTGAAKAGTPGFVDTPEQLAMAGGAAAILCGLTFLWRGRGGDQRRRVLAGPTRRNRGETPFSLRAARAPSCA